MLIDSTFYPTAVNVNCITTNITTHKHQKIADCEFNLYALA
ncbi:hypothetical protein NWP21_03325 [Anabaenopsis sp. FSS-46]|nr:hypothetical protein [Anabaenopsis sp. FSS-46]MDH6097891.1 hypothetical protein [Anabaenopsis sp. FSS-46]